MSGDEGDRRAIFIDRGYFASIGAVVLVASFVALGGLFYLAISTGGRSAPGEESLDRARSAFGGILVGAVVLAGTYYAIFKVIVWVKIGDDVTYRTLAGRRTLPWSQVWKLEMQKRETVAIGMPAYATKSVWERVSGVVGELVITTTNADQLRVSLTQADWDSLDANGFATWESRVTRGKNTRYSRARALGFVGCGTAMCILAGYCLYLIAMGQWLPLLDTVKLGRRGKWVLVYVLPGALPLLGIALMTYGVKKLVEKPGSWGEKQQL